MPDRSLRQRFGSCAIVAGLVLSLSSCSKGGDEATPDSSAPIPPEDGAIPGDDSGDDSPGPPAPPTLSASDYETACFDSYCPRQALAEIPITPASRRGAASFRAAFKEQLTGGAGYLTQIQNIYTSDLSHGPDWEWDYYNRVVGKEDWEPQLIMAKVGLMCSGAYQTYKQQQKDAGLPAPDPTTLDWKTLPECQAAGQWLEKVYGAWFGFQVMTHDIQPALGGAVPNPWDPYGVWKLTSGFSPYYQWWQGGGTFYPYARYAHLLSKEFLATSRPHIMAALCGLELGTSNAGTWDFRSVDAAKAGGSSAQWMLRVDAWAQMTTALLRTEKVLGVAPSATNCSAGTYSSVDALATSERLATNTLQVVQQGGEQPEYHTSYDNFLFWELAHMMSTPSSQKIYDAAAEIYRAVLWDIAANFSPATGTMTGPSNRNYDLFLGSQNGWENYTIPIFIQPFFHPYCDKFGSCSAATPATPILPVSSTPALPYFDTFFAMWQLGGFGEFPYQDVVGTTVESPIRTTIQRAGFSEGKARQHFISPFYSMGNAGDDANEIASNYLLTARLGGPPNPKFPLTPNRDGHHKTDSTFAVGEIRHMLSSQDDPFTNATGVPGMQAQLTPRQVVAQYQSWMLVTHLAVPGRSGSDKYGEFTLPLSSNLLFPLAVDEIYADDKPLPRTKGSAMALPQGALLTLRLGNASVVIRTLVFESSASSSLKQATDTIAATLVAPGSANYQYAIQWQVDDSSEALGYGKVVFTHKAAADKVNRPYHIAWLWAGGVTRTAAEMAALQKVVRDVALTKSTLETSGKWDLTSNMFTGDFVGTSPVGSCTWTIELDISGQALRVMRQDFYDPWGNDPIYQQVDSSFPYYTLFERTWNGAPTMPPNNWGDGELTAFIAKNGAIEHNRANLTIPYAESKFFQPHLATYP